MKAGNILNGTDNTTVHSCKEAETAACIMAISPSTIRLFLYMFIGGSLSLVTINGNLLVITSVAYFKQLHTPTNYLILSLAVADLLVGAVVLLFNMALTVKSCLYFGDLIYRYYAVCQPLTYRSKINDSVVLLMILGSWSASALSGFGIMFVGLRNFVCEGRCFLFHIPKSNTVGLIVSFYIPVMLMLFVYLKIFSVAQKQARCIQNATCQAKKSIVKVNKMERKATKTLAVVLGVFLFCCTPFFLSLTINPMTDYVIPSALIETFSWLSWSNSMLNPFVYGFFYSWFRSAFRIIISGKIFKGNFKNTKLL
ncbi:trace amine-associated receptor 1-like [Salarias fasciatus]|uniref:trace amine-associated receptor 1-like n=1 Tax=Salarias fasciatus TaxID=181472 RepID=UPI001176A75B|nr:trace amine-associated receptor 1-like [Salarias fasciatus]